MSDPVLEHGQTFKIGKTEFEVIHVSTNEERGEHVYEIAPVADMEKRREEEERAAAQARADAAKEAEKVYQDNLAADQKHADAINS